MEGLIIMAVIAILSSFFSGNKKKEQKSMPPFGRSTTQNSDKPKEQLDRKKNTSLEDFAKEIFQQLNEKNVYPVETIEPQVKKVPEDKKIELQPTQIQKQDTIQHSRPKLDDSRSTRTMEKPVPTPMRKIDDKIKENEIGNFIPSSRGALVQAIITSEIIGPPKAKR